MRLLVRTANGTNVGRVESIPLKSCARDRRWRSLCDGCAPAGRLARTEVPHPRTVWEGPVMRTRRLLSAAALRSRRVRMTGPSHTVRGCGTSVRASRPDGAQPSHRDLHRRSRAQDLSGIDSTLPTLVPLAVLTRRRIRHGPEAHDQVPGGA